MKSPLILMSLVIALLLASCADSAWMAERAAAKNAGGRTFTTFVLNNRQGMDANLKYWDEASDLKQAYRYATPSEQRILQARYNKVQRDWAAADARDAQQSAYWASARASNSSTGSSYTPAQSTSYSDALERNKRMHDQDTINRLRYNQQQLRSNPNTSY